jgi:hypothetical protein
MCWLMPRHHLGLRTETPAWICTYDAAVTLVLQVKHAPADTFTF